MKVILKKEIKGLGKINSIVNVKNGYATNYLFKNNFAVMADEKNLNNLNMILEKQSIIEQESIAKFNSLKIKIEKITLNFKLKTNKNKSFGSISLMQIIDELLEKHSIKIDKFMIGNQDKKFDLGIHILIINLYKGISAKLNINVESE